MTETTQPHELTGLMPELQAERRQTLLDDFAERPTEEGIWQTAYRWAEIEGDDTGSADAIAIPAAELIALADTVRATPPDGRYDLMIAKASNGQRWFDVLGTFSSAQIRQAVTGVISVLVNAGETPAKFRRALDIGTGTGNSLPALEANAEQVVGVDRNATLLGIARENAAAGTELVRGEVGALGFDDASFDLITSSGLTGALDRTASIDFYTELARLLKPGGVYIEGSYWAEDGYAGEELARTTRTSKAMLADMVVDTVSGKLQLRDYLAPEEQEALLQELGLKLQYFDAPAENDPRTHSVIAIITHVPK